MAKLTPQEAADFGFYLTTEQKEMLNGEHEYALIAQPLPVPHSCEDSCLSLCTHDGDERRSSRRRLILPTVVELVHPEYREQIDALELERERPYKRFWTEPDGELPDVMGYGVHLGNLALDMTCGHEAKGDIGCGCWNTEPLVFSAYGAVPLTEQEAIDVIGTAYKELGAGSYTPLERYISLSCHGFDDLDSEDLEGIDPNDMDAISDLLDSYLEEPMEHLEFGKDGHLHVGAEKYTYRMPESVDPKLLELRATNKRALSRIKQVFKRDPSIVRRERDRLFAYPVGDW